MFVVWAQAWIQQVLRSQWVLQTVLVAVSPVQVVMGVLPEIQVDYPEFQPVPDLRWVQVRRGVRIHRRIEKKTLVPHHTGSISFEGLSC